MSESAPALSHGSLGGEVALTKGRAGELESRLQHPRPWDSLQESGSCGLISNHVAHTEHAAGKKPGRMG